MKTIKHLLKILLVFWVFDTQSQVLPSHPRIFIDSTLMNTLQNRRIRNTIEWQKMNTWVEIMKPNTASYIVSQYEGQHYAFGFMLSYWATNDTSYRNKAIQIFKAYWATKTDASIHRDNGFDSRGMMADCAILYDWMYPYLDEPFKQAVRTRLVVWADWILANGYGTWNGQYYYEGNNYVVGHILGITATAHAIYDDDPVNGARLLNIATTQLARINTFIGTRLKGGDANEGWSYGAGYFHNLMKIYGIFKSASSAHTDYFAQTQYEEEAQQFLIYATLPNKANLLAEGDWSRESSGSIWDMNRWLADLVSTYSDNQTIRQVARFYANEIYPSNKWSSPTSYWWNLFLFSNQEIQSTDYRTVPPFNTQNYIFTDTTGTGQFIQRENWQTNGQWMSFRAGGHYGDHAHDGQGHFNLWENGWLIVDRNTINSSGIEAQDDYSNAFQFYANNKAIHYAQLGYPNAEHSLIPQREFTNSYSYLNTDNTRLYTLRTHPSYNNVVNKAKRALFYLPTQKTMVIFDNAETKSDTNAKAYRVTYQGVPSINGKIMRYSNGTTKVYNHTVFPQNVSTYQPYDCSTCRPRYRYIDVKYPNQQKQNYFVNVIYTKPNADTTKRVSAISRASGNVLLSDFYGSLIEGDTTNIAVLFAGDSATYSYDSLRYRIDNSRQSHHYVAGLKSSTNYYVTKTNVASLLDVRISLNPIPNASVISTSVAGILEFHNSSLFTGINLSVSTIQHIKCNGGNDGQITLVATGGDNNISFSKDGTNFQSSNIFTGLTAGGYTISAMDGTGVTATISVTITQPLMLNLTTNNNSPFCGGNTLNLTSGVNGGTSPYGYVWQGANAFNSTMQNPSIANATPTAQGVYTLTVTDRNGCTASATTLVIIYEVPAAPAISASQNAVCGIALVTVSATGCTDGILWSNGRTTMSFVDTVFVNISYSAICRNASGCNSPNSNQLLVTANPIPQTPTIRADTTKICGSGNVNLTAHNCVGAVVWSNNMTGASITVTLNQTTTFTATCGFRTCSSCNSNAITVEVVGNSLINLVSPTDNYTNGTVIQQTNDKIRATNKVFGGARATYKAGKSIELNDGFRADSGSNFKAEIGGCNN
ncbi:MAG: 3-coathanger stack domain-containing protein [Spirosomataceae bacterium]